MLLELLQIRSLNMVYNLKVFNNQVSNFSESFFGGVLSNAEAEFAESEMYYSSEHPTMGQQGPYLLPSNLCLSGCECLFMWLLQCVGLIKGPLISLHVYRPQLD